VTEDQALSTLPPHPCHARSGPNKGSPSAPSPMETDSPAAEEREERKSGDKKSKKGRGKDKEKDLSRLARVSDDEAGAGGKSRDGKDAAKAKAAVKVDPETVATYVKVVQDGGWKSGGSLLLSKLAGHESAWPFMQPLRGGDASSRGRQMDLPTVTGSQRIPPPSRPRFGLHICGRR
jgi:hypothetical protein